MKWYAILMDENDNDWGTGSRSFDRAMERALEMGAERIAIIEDGDDPVCIKTIDVTATRYGARENKQVICDALCATLRLTTNAGDGNALRELRYLEHGNGRYSEAVRPVFEDGIGEDGYYDINVSCDSGTAMIVDIANQFIRKVW